MRIPLTSGQIVTIHGWNPSKETLSWSDVMCNDTLTFDFLHRQTCIPKEMLYRLQPDIAAWVSAKRVVLSDLPALKPWGAHPIRDLGADLGELLDMGWDAASMRKAGVTYSDLMEVGMTPMNMKLFGYTLYDWSTLGFSESDAAGFTAPQLAQLFGLTRADVARCFIGDRRGNENRGSARGVCVTSTASRS